MRQLHNDYTKYRYNKLSLAVRRSIIISVTGRSTSKHFEALEQYAKSHKKFDQFVKEIDQHWKEYASSMRSRYKDTE